ncbi:His Kinase A (phospho-acceptor) domain-containing protein [Candidatus Electrothrix aarhusensis]|uniref:histidine kinase n=1 Tax=Candidatus Electrothrix aarhusensis TaxID=1859131 RepID=A0A3S3QHH8_9BACT|nr:His Kinase A (phospho-acceptor) domain-containing protein [Candidatus Electrothrix aarhusensis]
MKKCSLWLEKILPPPRGNFMIRADLDKGYRRFSRGLSLILTILVLVPMTIIAIVSNYQQVTIFILCALVAVLVVFQLSEAITDHLREAGLKREQFLARAEQPNKLASIGRLAAGVAHEINNPLAIINQQAGLIQDIQEMSPDFPHKDMVEESLAGIQNGVQRCKVITHRLLGFAHQTKVEMEKVDINALLYEAVDFLAEEASYNQIGMEFILDEDIRRPRSDHGELLQIFLNIIANAIDALAEGGGSSGRITLSSKQVGTETVRICIADNGPGMTTEVQKHIFDPFFTTKETGRGTGLGLSIVYGLIRKLGGTVNVVSEVGKGTEFEIDLPVHQEEE